MLAVLGALILAGTVAFVPESHPPALRRTGGLTAFWLLVRPQPA